MKQKFYFAAIIAVFALFPCCQQRIDSPVEKEKVTFNLGVVPPIPAKASGSVATSSGVRQTADESKVNNIQVFVFNAGIRDGYKSANISNQSSLTVTGVECTSGLRTVYAVINAASLASVQKESDLLAATSVLAQENDNFEMIGSDSENISSGSNVTVAVSRIASKIVLKKITNSLSSGNSIKVKRVYITNIAGKINFGLTSYAGASDTWYNKGGYQSSNNLGSFSNDISLDISLAKGASYDSKNFYYYAYPNNKARTDYASVWSPKRTMLVVQIEADGGLYDYPIDLGVDLASNRMYVINELVLQKIGNKDDGKEGGSDEENPVTGITANFTVTVTDWEIQLLGTSGVVTI